MEKSGKIRIKKSKTGKNYFVIVAPNGKVLASSELYSSNSKCLKGAMACIDTFAKGIMIE